MSEPVPVGQPVYVTVEQHQQVIKELTDLSKAMNGTIIQTADGPRRSPGLIDLVGDVMRELKGFKWLMGGVGIILLTSVVFDILKTIGIVHAH